MKTKKGFTLIEILIVIAIIGVLAAVVVIALAQSAKEKAKIAKGLQFADSVRGQLQGSLISHWSFNDGSNLGRDSWGGNNGTLINSPVQTNGVIGDSLEFDGNNNQYVNIANESNFDIIASVITVEVWAYGENSDQWDTILMKSNTWMDGYGLFYRNTGTLNFFTGVYTTAASAAFSLNEWHHIVGVYDGLSSRIFIDGVEGTPYSSAVVSNDDPVFIGKAGGPYGWDGKIDEVRIYGEALTAKQIQRLYAESAPKFRMTLK